MLGLQFAAAQQALVTVLRIVAPAPQASSAHWLDAIDRLHVAMSDGHNPADPRTLADAQAEVQAFLEREIPARLLASVDLRIECRVGDFASAVACYIEDAQVDMTVLCCEPTTWGLPILPGSVRRILELTQKRVILVRPDAERPAAT